MPEQQRATTAALASASSGLRTGANRGSPRSARVVTKLPSAIATNATAASARCTHPA